MNFVSIVLAIVVFAAVFAAMFYKPKPRAKFKPHQVKNRVGFSSRIQREPPATSTPSASSNDLNNNLQNTALLSAVMASDSNDQSDRYKCDHSSPSHSYEPSGCSNTSYDSSGPSGDNY